MINGCSTVDYALVNQSIIDKVYSFNVIDWSEIGMLSDHSPITLSLSISASLKPKESIPITKLANQFIWHDEISRHAFWNNINSPETEASLQLVNKKLDTNDVDLNLVVKNISTILIDVSRKCLKPKKMRRNVKQKRWFSDKCAFLLKTCRKLSRELEKSPYDRELRSLVYAKMKAYKRMCRKTKRDYRNKIFGKLNGFHEKDPNSYWKLFNKLKDGISSEDHIKPSSWQDHYTKLLGTKVDESSPHDKIIISKLEKMELQSSFTELDFSISQKRSARSD